MATVNGTTSDDVLTGTTDADTISGLAGADTIFGLAGTDVIDGGTGADIMVGGNGDDTYTVDDAGDVVSEGAGSTSGTDLVNSSISYTVTPNIENLTLTGSGNINGTGNDLANIITGNTGNNVITGGAGNDTLDGDAGTDTVSYADDSGGVTVNLATGSASGSTSGTDTLTNFENATGGAGDDTLIGDANSNVLDGGVGNDTLIAGTGNVNDTLTGGSGTDTADYSAATVDLTIDLTVSTGQAVGTGLGTDTLTGIENLIGGSGNDTFTTTATAGSVLTGGDGNDVLKAGVGQGTDTLAGGAGTDTADYSAATGINLTIDLNNTGAQAVGTGLGNDTLSGIEIVLGSTGNDTFTAAATGSTLDGGAGNDTLSGGAGTDTLAGGAGTDTLAGGAGTDTADYSAATGINLTVDLSNTGVQTVGTGLGDDTLSDIENVTGATGDDTFTAAATGGSVLTGGAGNDTLRAGLAAGNDTLTGGAGTDTADYSQATVAVTVDLSNTGAQAIGTGLGTDTLTGIENATGGAGDDTLIGDANNNALAGGSGTDTADYSAATVDLTIDLTVSTGQAVGTGLGTDTLTGIENLIGGTGNDTFAAAATGSILTGGAGIDTLTGGAGTDTLIGGAGTDTMAGGAGDDIFIITAASEHTAAEITGSAGIDEVRLTSTTAGTFTVFAGDTGLEAVTISDAAGVTTGTTAENINAGAATAGLTLTGNSGDNSLTGSASADTLIGGAGTDTMAGGAGNDIYIIATEGEHTAAEITDSAGTDTVRFTSTTAGTFTVFAGDTGLEAVTISDAAGVTTGTTAENVNASAAAAGLTLTGNDGANSLTGSAFADTLTGGAGTDTLIGGAGTDTMAGGAGDDIFIITAASEHTAAEITDSAGTDTARFTSTAAGTFTVFAGDTGLEGVTISDAAGVTTGTTAENINASAATTDLVITGNDGVNSLTGGSGNDTIVGGAGSDIIFGGAGTDTLDGGLGDDPMLGGADNDTYIVDSVDDVTIELAGGGTDLVISMAANHSLAPDVENLTLGGSSNINGTGNATANTLTGNSGNNILDGGLGDDTLTGGAGTDTLIGGGGTDTMAGGTGDDTYVVDATTDVVTEAASAGTDLVQSSVTYTLGANIENLTLTGSAAINGTGNAANNVITGNSGNNVLDGGAGTDTLAGGAGADTYVVDATTDVVTEAASAGTDLVQSSVTYTLGANIENLTLTGSAAINGTGNTSDNILTGNSAANVLNGDAGTDTLNGDAGTDTLNGGAGTDTLNGGAGTDTLNGGAGDDTYIVDATTDVVTEAASAGTDLVQSSVTYTLGTDVENLTLTGAAAINGTGNALANILTGNSAANVLNGGAGTDALAGGGGNDIYIIAVAGDHTAAEITDSAGADTVRFTSTAAGTFTVFAGDTGLEAMTISDAAGVATGTTAENVDAALAPNALTITGNTGNNILTGSAFADTLNSGAGNDTLNSGAGNDTLNGDAGNDTLNGGAGTDTLAGGAGDDTYIVDVTTDIVTEAASAGTDLVQSSATYTLGTDVENLTLTGAAAINGTGNAANNVLTGNSAANVLTGLAGNDTYIVDNIADTVVEAANEGTDVVQSSVNWTLGTDVENLTLTGTTAINGTGNAANNVLTGNSAANVLSGGLGSDTLTGGAGTDTFDFNLVTESAVGASHDTITDFSHAQGDHVDLTSIDANTILGADQAFTFIGSSAFGGSGVGSAGELRYAGGLIQGDINGDGTTDFEIAVTSSPALVSGDFFL